MSRRLSSDCELGRMLCRVLGLSAWTSISLASMACDRGLYARGRVTDASGKGLPGVTVTLRRPEPHGHKSVTTESDGAYEIGALETASEVVMSGHLDGYREVQVTLPGRGSFACDLALEPVEGDQEVAPRTLQRATVCRPNE